MNRMNRQTPDARGQGPDIRSLPGAVRRVIAIAAEDHKVSAGMILSKNREQPVVLARRQTCQILRRMGFSLPQIGRFLGIHHTSVLYAHQKLNPKRHELTVPDLSGEWAI